MSENDVNKVVPIEEDFTNQEDDLDGVKGIGKTGVAAATDSAAGGAGAAAAAASSLSSGDALPEAEVDQDLWERGTQNEYQRHMASLTWLDKSFVYNGLKSMRQTTFWPIFFAPIIYAHGFTYTYAFLADYFVFVMIFHFCISCSGVKNLQQFLMARLYLGEPTDKVPRWIDPLLFFLTQVF